jgi:hypothetical protein
LGLSRHNYGSRRHNATKSENDAVQKVQELHFEHPSMASLWALDGDEEILLRFTYHSPSTSTDLCQRGSDTSTNEGRGW